MLVLAEKLNNLLREKHDTTLIWFQMKSVPQRVIYSQDCIDCGWPTCKQKPELTAVIPGTRLEHSHCFDFKRASN